MAAIIGGGAAGFGGAALAHILTTLADRLGAENWLRGPYGPQFVPIALYTGIFYGAIGAAGPKGWAAGPKGWAAGRRATTALLGFLGPLLGIAGTMLVLTRYSGWGMPRGLPSTPQWQLAVILIYTVAVWGTIAVIGATSAATTRSRGALAAVLGSLSAYGVLSFFLWAVPSYAKARWSPTSLLPSPINLMDGLLSGAGLCLALTIDEKIRRHA